MMFSTMISKTFSEPQNIHLLKKKNPKSGFPESLIYKPKNNYS